MGWVGLFCWLVSWVGLGPLATGLGWVVLQACFVGWVGSISYWVGLDWITENGPTSMSAHNYLQLDNTRERVHHRLHGSGAVAGDYF